MAGKFNNHEFEDDEDSCISYTKNGWWIFPAIAIFVSFQGRPNFPLQIALNLFKKHTMDSGSTQDAIVTTLEYYIVRQPGIPNQFATHLSHEKNPLTFHDTGWLIGILIMVYYNPYITG